MENTTSSPQLDLSVLAKESIHSVVNLLLENDKETGAEPSLVIVGETDSTMMLSSPRTGSLINYSYLEIEYYIIDLLESYQNLSQEEILDILQGVIVRDLNAWDTELRPPAISQRIAGG